MVVGHQEMKKEEREEQIRDKADRKRKVKLSVGLKPSTPTTEVRIRKTSANSHMGSARSSRAGTPPLTSSSRVASPNLTRRRSRTFTSGFFDFLFLKFRDFVLFYECLPRIASSLFK